MACVFWSRIEKPSAKALGALQTYGTWGTNLYHTSPWTEIEFMEGSSVAAQKSALKRNRKTRFDNGSRLSIGDV